MKVGPNLCKKRRKKKRTFGSTDQTSSVSYSGQLWKVKHPASWEFWGTTFIVLYPFDRGEKSHAKQEWQRKMGNRSGKPYTVRRKSLTYLLVSLMEEAGQITPSLWKTKLQGRKLTFPCLGLNLELSTVACSSGGGGGPSHAWMQHLTSMGRW